MTRALAVRALGLYLPIAVAGALWCCRQLAAPKPLAKAGPAILLASAWNATALLMLHFVATRVGWWEFHATGGLFAGIPLDLYLGWIVLWGAVPVLAFPSTPLPLVAAAMFGIDLLVMPFCEPVVSLGPSWLIGEAAAVAVVLVPALCLARWTITDSHLDGRAVLQVVAFSGLVLLVIPEAVLEQTGGSWKPLLDRSPRWNVFFAQLLAIPAILGLSAVQEFVLRGQGTPIPYDPPKRLVTSGPYAYLANPMQLATLLVFLLYAVMLESPWMIGGSVMTLAYGVGLAGWHEDEDLAGRFGEPWVAYRRAVPRWWPRWRPFDASAGLKPCATGVAPAGLRPSATGFQAGRQARRARLYVAHGCPTCRGVGAWLARQNPIALDIVAAELHPTRDLERLTYEPADEGQPEEEGVAALARALEHISFGWAFLGMFIRLPITRGFFQLLVDASGGHRRSFPVSAFRRRHETR
jgi:protein-S-isoprenylcysteine O-methyltransferase Ste14